MAADMAEPAAVPRRHHAPGPPPDQRGPAPALGATPARTRNRRRAAAGAAGLYPLEAACELLIGTSWLHRDDFTCFIRTGTSITDGVTELAEIDWQAVITSRDDRAAALQRRGEPDLRLAASIAAGIPVDLQHALSGLDQASISLIVRAVRHANGQRPDDCLPRDIPHTAAAGIATPDITTGETSPPGSWLPESPHGSSAHGECGNKAHLHDRGS